jgi:Flp pilus assembly protein TadG
MPGLTLLRRRARTRLSGERGAVAAVVALLLVPLLGFAAIAVDVGAFYAERARLQTAADAAALAVARDCAVGACGDMQATAQELVTANVGAGEAEEPELGANPSTVTVTGNNPVEHWFAPVIGHDSTQVSATATVAWGAPGGGTAALPIAFSWCSFDAQTHGSLPTATDAVQRIYLSKSDLSGDHCTGPSDNVIPGGFGYLVPDPGRCGATSKVAMVVTSNTGNSAPCTAAEWTTLVGRTVLLPIFDDFGGNGSHGWYRVYGYAAFQLTGFDLGGQHTTDKKLCGNGSTRCIAGRFLQYVEPSDAFFYDSTAPSMGAWILRLVR